MGDECWLVVGERVKERDACTCNWRLEFPSLSIVRRQLKVGVVEKIIEKLSSLITVFAVL